jgi:hypothetical protein
VHLVQEGLASSHLTRRILIDGSDSFSWGHGRLSEIGFRGYRPARYTACLATLPRHCLVHPVNISPPDWAKAVSSLAFRITPKQLAQSAMEPRIMNAGKQGSEER